jgi:erlin
LFPNLDAAQDDQTWIFERLHAEINQFCSRNTLQDVYIDKFDTLDEALAEALQRDCDKHNTGIEIIAVRLTKPRIPANIQQSYDKVEAEKTRLLVVKQQQLVTLEQEETERRTAAIRAQKTAEVAQIMQNQITMEKRAEAERQLIENDLHVAKERARTDAAFDRAMKEAKGLRAKLTPEFLQLSFFENVAKALGNQNLIYFGKDLPEVFYNMFPSNLAAQYQQQFQFPQSSSTAEHVAVEQAEEAKEEEQVDE